MGFQSDISLELGNLVWSPRRTVDAVTTYLGLHEYLDTGSDSWEKCNIGPVTYSYLTARARATLLCHADIISADTQDLAVRATSVDR